MWKTRSCVYVILITSSYPSLRDWHPHQPCKKCLGFGSRPQAGFGTMTPHFSAFSHFCITRHSFMRSTLYLLPGLLCDARVWRHQALHLQDIVDIRIPDFSRFDSLQAMADCVLAEAPQEFYLAG